MQSRFATRFGGAVLAAGLLVGLAGAASAHPGKANTHMRFRIVDHHVASGDTVTGPVHMTTGNGRHRAPMAGASLSVRVDGTEIGTLTTDADGNATVSFTADTAGGHVVRVVYAGDDTHRKRQRAQGFSVGDGETSG